MRKNPTYIALLRPTRLLIFEKSGTCTIIWSYTIIWQVRVYTLVRTDLCTTIFYLSLECLNETQTLVKALRVPPTALLKTSTLLTTELWLEDSIYENNMPVSTLTCQIIVQQILLFLGEINTYTTLLGPTRLLISDIFPSKPDFYLYK